MTEPRRVYIASEYLCDGIEWIPTKEEWGTPLPQRFDLERVQRPGKPPIPRPWPERLSEQLLRDLKAWNGSWEPYGAPDLEAARVKQEQGRELAIRVQDELGPTAGKCSTTWAAGCTECIRRAAGLTKHGCRTFSATRA